MLKENYHKLRSILGLSLSLAKANFKVRNEGSYLGIFWYLLEPLLFFVILLFLGGVISRTPIENYPLYLLLGLIMFNFFIAATSSSTKAIRNNAGFIKSLKINKEPFVLSGIIQFCFSHIFEVILFLGLMIYLKADLLALLFYPLIFGFLLLFTIGVCFILSIIGAHVYDLSNIWPVLTRLLWFATPIFYVIPEGTAISIINKFNPLYYFISIAREIIVYNKVPPLNWIITIVSISLITFIFGIFIFEKNKEAIAEKI